MILSEQFTSLSNELPADFRAAIRTDVANLEQRLRTMFIKRGPIPYDRGQVFTVSDLRRNEAQWGRVARLGLLLHCFSEDLCDFRFTNRENLDPDILERVGLVPDGSGDVFAASGRPDRDAVTEIIGVWQSLRFRLECRERAEENQGVGLMNMTEDNIFNLAVDEWQQQRESQCPVCDCLVEKVLADCPGCNSSWTERELHRANASANREIHIAAQAVPLALINTSSETDPFAVIHRAVQTDSFAVLNTASETDPLAVMHRAVQTDSRAVLNTASETDPLAVMHRAVQTDPDAPIPTAVRIFNMDGENERKEKRIKILKKPRKVQVKDPEPDFEQWACASCRLYNSQADKICSACSIPRTPCPEMSRQPEPQWACASCTLYNSQADKICSACAIPRTPCPEMSRQPEPAGLASWRCLTCQYHKNEGLNCEICKEPRDKTAPQRPSGQKSIAREETRVVAKPRIPPEPQQAWKCSSCTMKNDAGAANCSACLEPKP